MFENLNRNMMANNRTEITRQIMERLQDSDAVENMVEHLQGIARLQQLYQAAIWEVSTKLEVLDNEFHFKFDHNPIHHMESRLKTTQGIAEKLTRKGFDLSTQSARENITDIAGIRVICSYVEDIYTIAKLLVKQDDIVLLRESDYISNPKPNGYRSLHLIISIPVFLSEGKEVVPVEIQIRTIAMDFWASLEHQIRYKGRENITDKLINELKDCADIIAETDLRMQNINNELKSSYFTLVSK